MSNRAFIWAATIALSGLLLAGCGSNENDNDGAGDASSSSADATSSDATSSADAGSADAGTEPVNLIFGTGGTSGSYYPIGGALKKVFEDSDQVKNVQVVSTGASVQNINNIEDGTNQMALVMSDVAFDAINGKNQFEGRKADIKTIAGLYPNVVQIVATANSGITSVADMKGKRIGVGKVGSGVEQSAKKVLEAAGMSYDDLGQVSHTGYADSVTGMSNGNIDAAFFTSGVPNSSITGLMQNTDVTFVNVDGDTASKLLEKYPYYEKFEIPASAPERYDLDKAVNTVAIRNILIVPASMDDAVAKDLAKRFYDYLGTDKVSVGALKTFDRSTMGKDLVVPLAPGAESFYKNMGDSGDTSDQKAGDSGDDAGSSESGDAQAG
ncbi:TAXI family TRAP transporter solute-binding subunit [Salinisphaera aquimarina]|uniref:TAXI family TRAP transporter solute-binding subunit n=1 Tax=Salinisphaera aquimarina TaxID=2094031 RepID=A0ABV7ERL3_9GAMM